MGGSSGDWFDPRNWAGGAVPDRANVPNVQIPAGVTVRFGSGTSLPPAEDGPVKIDGLGDAGQLDQSGGTLHVGAGGVRLDGYSQSEVSRTSKGAVRLDSLVQTGGSMDLQGNLDAGTGAFRQGPAGSINVAGAANIRPPAATAWCWAD